MLMLYISGYLDQAVKSRPVGTHTAERERNRHQSVTGSHGKRWHAGRERVSFVMRAASARSRRAARG
jgi:hypothetical protein